MAKKVDLREMANFLFLLVPRERLELSRGQAPRDFKSLASTSSATQANKCGVKPPLPGWEFAPYGIGVHTDLVLVSGNSLSSTNTAPNRLQRLDSGAHVRAGVNPWALTLKACMTPWQRQVVLKRIGCLFFDILLRLSLRACGRKPPTPGAS